MHTESIPSLVHRIREAKDSEQQRFIFFLGAGASQSSGIPVASRMINEFQRKLREIWEDEGRPNSDFDTWVQSKPGWDNNQSDYAKYFEAYEPTENGRVRYINKWMAAASPRWGYFCLAQLLAQSYVSTIVTSNFDDLIYDSCTQNSVRRPRVYSTSSPSAMIEHDHDRSTIIKLHGDYLYADIRNTADDMQKLDQRLMDSVSTLFQQHEIIVVGYSGTDDRIMNELFKKVPLTNAVYWCTYKNNPVPNKVKEIVEDGHLGHWFKVRTEGFDEFMDELINQLDFSLPGILQPIQDQIDAIPGRIEGSQSRHVEKYFSEAIQQIRKEEEELARAHGMLIPPTPYRLRLEAMNARRKREYDDAIKIYEQLVDLPKQDTCEVLIEYAVTLELMGEYSRAQQLRPKIEPNLGNDSDLLGNYGLLLANLGMYEDGIKYVNQAIIKGPGFEEWPPALAMILSEDGRIDDALRYARQLTKINPGDGQSWAALSMIESLAGNYAKPALECAEQAVALNAAGFNENLSLAFTLSGCGDYKGAIAALQQIIEQDDDIFYRCLGHFQILAGEFDNAVDNLRKAVEFTLHAKRPKALALYGVALLGQGSREKAQQAFELATSGRHPDRHYKADDELAFAMCILGAGQAEAGRLMIQNFSQGFPDMRGLLLETSALLDVMQTNGIEGCDDCINLIANALPTIDSNPDSNLGG